MRTRLIAPAALLLLTACAAAVPGYTPPAFNDKKPKIGAMESGDIGSEGRYEMSSTEKAMDCKRLTGSMHITISRLKDAYARMEPSAAASTAHKMAGPVLGGSTVGADRQQVQARERAKLDAYNRELAAKGCKTLDVEAELAKPPETGKKY